jgi:hypothetical protein
MCSDVRYNTWLYSLLSRWILGGGCLSPAGAYVELHFYHVLPSSAIYWYVNDLEDGSGLLWEHFVHRQCTFLFDRVINFLTQYMASAGNL